MTKTSKETPNQQLRENAVSGSDLSISQIMELEITKIFFLANQINRKTEMCCFANDVAHCHYVEIRLHKSKKDTYSTPIFFKLDYEIDKQYSWKYDSEQRVDNAKKCVEFLEKTLKENNIDYSLLTSVKEYVITHYEV